MTRLRARRVGDGGTAPARKAAGRVRRARPARASAAWRNGRATMRGCRAFPTNISARTARRAPVWTPVLRRLCRAVAGRDRAALRLRRPASARGRRNLPRARRDRRPAVAAQPSAAADRRGRLAAIDRRHRAARANCSKWCCAIIYGEGRLVAEGAIPAAAIAGSTEYLRAVCGVKPPGGRYLHLYAADVGRGPDGRWWVLGDRTQAPSGAGYALENRLVLSRAFSSALQIDECRARRAVLRGVPRRACAPAPTATSRASAC